MWRFRNILFQLLSPFSSQSLLFVSPHQRVITAFLVFLPPPDPTTPQQSTHYWAISHWPLALWAARASDGPDESARGWECRDSTVGALWDEKRPRPIKNQSEAPLQALPKALGTRAKSAAISAKRQPAWLSWVLFRSLIWAAKFV